MKGSGTVHLAPKHLAISQADSNKNHADECMQSRTRFRQLALAVALNTPDSRLRVPAATRLLTAMSSFSLRRDDTKGLPGGESVLWPWSKFRLRFPVVQCPLTLQRRLKCKHCLIQTGKSATALVLQQAHRGAHVYLNAQNMMLYGTKTLSTASEQRCR